MVFTFVSTISTRLSILDTLSSNTGTRSITALCFSTDFVKLSIFVSVSSLPATIFVSIDLFEAKFEITIPNKASIPVMHALIIDSILISFRQFIQKIEYRLTAVATVKRYSTWQKDRRLFINIITNIYQLVKFLTVKNTIFCDNQVLVS